jgi:hypothetical protein
MTSLQYLFVHMLVYNEQFIIQYARYEHKSAIHFISVLFNNAISCQVYTKLCIVED